MMRFYDKAERWQFGSDPKFLYTHVIYRNDSDEYFSVELSERALYPEDLPVVDYSRLKKIPPEHIWARLEEDHKFTICPNPESPDVYIKRPRLTGYDGSASLGENMLREAHTCEVLMRHPHGNVARYLGCVVKADRITGLCFQKYVETLQDRLEDGRRQVNSKSCLRQVRAGIAHLHGLNLVHNDIHPRNVMFVNQDGDALVIIDFDSCAFQGDVIPRKRGPVPENACTAEFRNDEFGLQKLREGLDRRERDRRLGQRMTRFFRNGLEAAVRNLRYLGHSLKKTLS